MHLLVTDILSCPNCGPAFGLILFAATLEDRRVFEGYLGCSNCRERYPVTAGLADLRVPSERSGSVHATEVEREGEVSPARDPSGDAEETIKLAALLGLQDEVGHVLLTGVAVDQAARLSSLLPGVEVLASHPGLAAVEEADGVSRVLVGSSLPFYSRTLRGIVLEGEGGGGWLAEGIRVLMPGARLLLFDPPPDAGRQMEGAGLELLLEAEGVLVGALK
jgi:uncharacterized protein YbaR (Trm112 family)